MTYKLPLIFLLSVITIQASAQKKKNSKKTEPIKTDTIIINEIKDDLLDNIPIISIDENDVGDGNSQNISSVLTAGRDPFFSAAAFNFSAVRFRIRGYDADLFSIYINGQPMDNIDNGFTPFGLWGGLNDVMRNREVSIGLRTTTFAFGDIGSNTNIDVRASKQRKQTSISYALSNRNYNNRLMLTHGTGMSKKGWAFAFSGSKRWAEEGYVPGTFYDGYSYFAAVDKRIGQKHLLSLSVLGTPTKNGRQGPALQESIELAGTNYYNPYWGLQNGQKRNASVGFSHQPMAILNHEYRIKNNTTLLTGISYMMGERGTTALDWYNAPDPRPDYYRYLPSYQTSDLLKQLTADAIRSDVNQRQINWHRLYDVNRNSFETIRNAGGIPGNNVAGKRSRYIIEERVSDAKRLNFNTVLNTVIKEKWEVTAGASYQMQDNHYFKRVNDLLGGEFYVDLNQFAERDFPLNPMAAQNDINRPNRVLREGDKFGYDYNIHVNRAATWSQVVLKLNKFDFFLAGEVSSTQFYRKGNVTNGLFPNNSFGKSTTYKFFNYAAKGGVTYKLNGRNYFYFNVAHLTKAPYFDNVFISPRTRDVTQANVESEKILTGEGGYILNAPKLKIRASGYITRIGNQMNVMTFYHDEYRNFVNYALRNIDKFNFGGEFGFEARVYEGITLNGAAAVGRYFYDSRQIASVTQDNNAEALERDRIYSNGHRIGSTPQEAYSLGINYRSPKFWFVSLTANYFAQMWLEINPIRRTYKATEGVAPKSANWYNILNQTQWQPQYTVDFFGGYSWKAPSKLGWGKNTFIVWNAGINNILNNQNIVTGGFEQLRFDFEGKNVNKFPAKLFYGYGLNYFTSLTLRF